MGWLFSQKWQSKQDVMEDCARLTDEAKERGWELVCMKLCKGGFALAYDNIKTGEMSISYHLVRYERKSGYGEKCVDPFIAWKCLPKKIVAQYMETHGDEDYCGKTKREWFEEMKGGRVT